MDGARGYSLNIPGFTALPAASRLRVTALAAFFASAAAPLALAQSLSSDTTALSNARAIVRDAADPAVLQRFLDAYLTSPFAAQARARLSELAPRPGFAPPKQPLRMPPAQSAASQEERSETPAEPLPPGATRGATYIGGWRPDGVRLQGRQIVRTIPANPAIGADALSPQPLAKAGNQLGGGASHYSGYLPAPRKVPTTVIPALALPDGSLPGAPARR